MNCSADGAHLSTPFHATLRTSRGLRRLPLWEWWRGTWRVRVAGRGMFFLVVQARSELSLDRVEFVREGGRPGHEGLFPTHEPPRAAVPQSLAIAVSGNISDVRARLVTSAFEEITALPLRESSSGAIDHEFVAQVTPPATPFRIVLSGVDALGLPFQRVHAPLFEPTRR